MIDVKIGQDINDFADDKATMAIVKGNGLHRHLLETIRLDNDFVNDTDVLTAFVKSKVQEHKTDETQFLLTIALPFNKSSTNIPI